jgi:hypothetical protein
MLPRNQMSLCGLFVLVVSMVKQNAPQSFHDPAALHSEWKFAA